MTGFPVFDDHSYMVHYFFSLPRHPHISKKHGNRQAEGGGQFSRMESLTENIRNG